jgi:hypothetical protein
MMDQKLITYALKQGWPVTPAMKTKALHRAERTLDDPAAHPRAVGLACRTIIDACRVTLDSINVALRAEHQIEIKRDIEATRQEVKEALANPFRSNEDLLAMRDYMNTALEADRNGDGD